MAIKRKCPVCHREIDTKGFRAHRDKCKGTKRVRVGKIYGRI